MSNLTRLYELPQLRCLPMPGGEEKLLFPYVQNVAGCWVTRNKQQVEKVVGDTKKKWEAA